MLAIHDQSFPSTSGEDVGRGSPYGRGARELFATAASLGFDGIQFGPQGETALDNPSPYDGALFSKSVMSIALGTLAEDPQWSPLCEGLLGPLVDARPDGPAGRTQYRYAWNAARRTLATLHARFAAGGPRHAGLAADFAAFQRARRWHLEPDGAFEALAEQHGTDDWRIWPAPDRAASSEAREGARRTRPVDVERHAFGQFILHQQHRTMRQSLATADSSVAVYGDLPIGFSHRDAWSRRSLFRGDYLMGAPPSRTNPDGQPWGFPVLDPDQYFSDATSGAPGPVLDLVIARVDALLSDFDGLRIDHPHGLVCPWVYAAADPNPAVAVGRGARLFCSPNLDDHPALGRLAIPAVDQISADPGIARYADDWVRELRDDQVGRYGRLFDEIMARVSKAGRQRGDVVCEVLSTWPYPLRRVMERYDLGRFCVLQKADLGRADDGYRAENAHPRDWIMIGNHDTRPIWLLADSWHGTAAGMQWASYLADRLLPAPPTRARLARWIAADARHLCQAMFAALFASRAGQVSVFFSDLFGLRDIYNRPGIVDEGNWSLRLPPDWQSQYGARVQQLKALNVPLALCLALASRANVPATLLNGLLLESRAHTPGLDEEITALIAAACSDRV